MLEVIQSAPPDAILGLTEAFRKDPNPNKINLSVGVYQDETGATPILESVQQAGRQVIANQQSKSYLPIDGAPAYAAAVQQLIFGPESEVVTAGRAATSHTPGGTGALRVAADFIKQNLPAATVWLTEPTWPNHPNIFAAAGVPTRSFPYFDSTTQGLDFDQAFKAIQEIPAGDVILLHGCCHNPTGIDPTADQWSQLAKVVSQRGVLPLLDFAYQGFAEGLQEDAAGLQNFCQPGSELLISSSFSKNFGLYRERVGALTVVVPGHEVIGRVQSQIKRCIRSNYSNPPAHGAALVTTILEDSKLTDQWHGEVASMRDRINETRKALVKTLAAKGATADYSFMTRQRGMFSFSGLTAEQVDTLREKYSIYIVRSGRINVAGITPKNIEPLCEAIAEVT
jgi:aspartate/tyrosine/aromatic aminotransferase